MENELFFVGIREPVELRKELLTSSKTLIDTLRRYENYKDIKQQKQENTLELKRVFDELLVLNKKLRSKIPHMPIKTPTVEREEPTRPQPQKITKNNIDILEEELSKIEQRLGGLE